jgi:hypothetical protein
MSGFRSISFSDNRKSAIQNPKWAWIVAISVTFVMCSCGPGAADDESPPDRLFDG